MFEFLNEKYTFRELLFGKKSHFEKGNIIPISNDILYIDLDDTLAQETLAIEEGKNPYDRGFYNNLKPMPNGIDAVKKLSKFYNVHILSAPSSDKPNAWTEKVLWVKRYFGDLLKDKIILSSDKSLLDGKILIDNDINNSNFKGEFIHFGSSKYPDWDSILNYLIPKKIYGNGGTIKSGEQQIKEYRKEGIFINESDTPIIGILPISRFNGINADIFPSQVYVYRKGVNKWKKRIKNGERPFVLVDYNERVKQNRVRDGHHRLLAYQELGIENIPVIDVNGKILNSTKMESGGIVNETNYFENTEGNFYIIQPSEYDRIDAKEYVSAFGSRYKVKDGILYRASDHWGKMDSVIWNLKDKERISCLFDKELDINLEGYTQVIYAKIPFSEMKMIGKQLIIIEPFVRELIQKLNKQGNQALIVGGAVRDALLGIEPKDIDIEVYKISYNDLMTFLSNYGKVDLVGKKFGVIKFKPSNSDWTYDFSIPRKENKIGVGHTDFEIVFDKEITMEQAFSRRDFTVNAIGYDPIENKIYDYFGGVKDLENKVLKHTSNAFKEDPLRILRGMGFQARFNFTIHPDTISLILEMLKTNDFDDLSKERIYEEFYKWASKGIRHDLIFKFMRDTTLIDRYPELKLLKETPQDAIYHSEGDVEIHTSMTLREMDKIIEREKISGEEKIILVMAILLHDIAKPQTTKEEMKRGRMTITSHGHEAMGGEMVKEFLPRLGFHEELITPISNLVANHLSGVSISMIDSRSGKMKAVKKLSRRLYPATIQQLLYVMDADNYGRGGERKEATGKKELIELSAEADVQNKAYQPILMGRHLIEKGLEPSPKFKEILQKSFEAQESGSFNDLEGAKKWLQDNVDKF